MVVRRFLWANIVALAVVQAVSIGVCSAQSAASERVRVVASFSILADMVREVGGDAVEVTALVGPSADAHVFEPSPADARRVASAQLLVVNGLGFEGWLSRLVTASGYRGTVLVATSGVTPRKIDRAVDPHAWQSLNNALVYVENIHLALAKSSPSQAANFRKNADQYSAKIRALNALVRERIATVPAADRRVITSHDAFGYFGDAYQVEFIAAQSWSTDSEASAADVARIIRQLKARQVRAVFVENVSDPRLALRISREGGGVMGGTLYSDALSPPGTSGDTYLKLFQHNADTLVKALGVR